MWLNVLLLAILLICVITDLRSRKIYNKVIFPGLLIAFVSHLILGGWSSLLSAFIGFILGLAILLIPYLLGGMGAGDVKLLALIGAIKGAAFVVDTAIYMALLGGILALFVLLFQPGCLQRFKAIFYFFNGLRYGMKIPLGFDRKTMSGTYPYGVAIAGGAVLSLVWGGWF